MEDSIKHKYQKYKLRVKVWEKTFKKKYNRIPSKYDIRDAPKEIRDSYKMYYKLKTSFLEDTLNDILADDGFDIFENSQVDLDDSNNNSNIPHIPPDISVLANDCIIMNDPTCGNDCNPNSKISSKVFEPVEENKHNLNAWNDDVTKKQPISKANISNQSFKSGLNVSLFKSTSFSKRNPRKSVGKVFKSSQSSVNSCESDSTQCNETLPDLETILTQRSKDLGTQQPSGEVGLKSGYCKKDTESKLQLDFGWLSRNTEGVDPTLVKEVRQGPTVPLGINNINIPSLITAAKHMHFKEEQVPLNEGSVASQITNPSQEKIMKPQEPRDSDSVVSDSENEDTNDIPRHIAKRRRLLIDRNHEKSNGSSNEINPEPVNNSEPQKENAEDSCEQKHSTRKQKQKGKPTKSKSDSKQKNKKTELQKPPRRSKKTPKSQENEIEIPQETEAAAIDAEYKVPLDADYLKCLPRVNVDDIKKVNTLANEYINRNPQHDLTKKTKEKPASITAPENNLQKQLEDKISAGRLNENFVRINLEKKVFVRGKKTVNYSRYKKKLWKQKKASALTGPEMDMNGCDGGILTCFKCNQPGHLAQQCTMKGDSLLPMTAELDLDESPYPTLEEAELMASNGAVHTKSISRLTEGIKQIEEVDTAIETHQVTVKPQEQVYIGHKIPQALLDKIDVIDKRTAGSLYDLNPDGSVAPTTAEVWDALHLFGHQKFRKGQERAIMRILSGQSTLVTLSTGSGKSLCYQLPAYLYSKKKQAITLVISPLVSLMEDQVHGVPHFLRAHCLHTNQTPQQRTNVLKLIQDNAIDILLVSPEAVVSGERSTGFGSILQKLPAIAFACIDEAHCMSQWSHNFRPSYLMISKILRKKLGVKAILGLTATATLPTRNSLIRHLGIPDGEQGIISDIPVPNNLVISVSMDESRDSALMQLLTSERFDQCQSIIIYCTRRDECERIAGSIRTYMQDRKSGRSNTKKRKRVNWNAEAYHAGLPASRRRVIQNAFMKNELRIVVATIAFGMGINKPDIRSVIHYNMPRSFESYVQEIGRAGRDGQTAHCHLFLESSGNDLNELRRHVFANSIDRHVIRKLLQKIFISCSCQNNLKKDAFVQQYHEELKAIQQIDWDDGEFEGNSVHAAGVSTLKELQDTPKKRDCCGHEVGFSIEDIVQTLDIPEENIHTLLCYLELENKWDIHVLSSAYIKCKVISYGGSKYLRYAAKGCPPLAMAIALNLKNKKFSEEDNIVEFSVIDIAAAIGWNSGVVKHQLKNLEWTSENGYPKRTPISVSFSDLGFRIKAPGDFTLDEIDDALDTLYNRAVTQEHAELIQLQQVFKGLSSVAFKTYHPCSTVNFPQDRSDKLKCIIRDYFEKDFSKDIQLDPENSDVSDEVVIGDIHALINMYRDNNFSGRNIARIFHGIPSPNYSAIIWGRCKFWRAHCKTSFNRIVQLANSILVKIRM